MKKLLMMIGAAAVGAMLPMAAVAETAALSVTVSGNDVSVSAAAGVLDDTSALYLVWDSADRGENLADWPAENRIAYSGSPAVSSAAATYTLSKAGVPAGAYVRVLATSNVRLIGGYVTLAANQYINTGIKDTAAYGFEIRYRPLGTSSGNYSSLMGGVRDQFTVGMNGGNYDKYYIRYGNATEVGNPAYTLPNKTEPHTIKISDAKLYRDGDELTKKPDGNALGSMSGTVGRKGVDILLGVTWDKTNYSNGTLNGSYCHAEWYYATLLNNSGGALANLVPALRGGSASPEAVFYDTVSGECFKNAGTGTLAYSGETTNTVAVAAAATESFYNGRVATWTGGGDANDATNPLNWTVTDMGTLVADAIPATGTKIAGCTLAADADWSALAATGTWIQPVEYIDVAKNAYVDTSFMPNQDTRIVMDVTVQGSAEYWFGAWNSSYKSGAFSVCNDNTSIYIGYGDNGGSKISSPLSNGRSELDFSNGVFKVNGKISCTMPAQTFQVNYNLYLFAQNRKGDVTPHPSQTSIRFHSCQIYDNGTLVRDYVPVTVDGVAKIYDRKNNAFVEFSKANGAGSVLAGPASGGRIGEDFVEIDGTIDLAGHKLTVGDLAGTSTITDTVGGGELHVAVGSGLAVENTGVTLAGSLKLVKDGVGTFFGAKSGQTYTGGTLVNAGLLKSGVSVTPWGAEKALVTVADSGAAFDWNAMCSKTGTPYNFNIKGTGVDGGGAIVFTPGAAADANYTILCIGDLELSGDALVVDPSANSDNVYCGFVNPRSRSHTVTLNSHTLTIKAGAKFNFVGVSATDAGTIAFTTDATDTPTNRMASFWGSLNNFSNVTLDIAANIKLNVDTANSQHIVGTFIDRGVTGAGDQPLTVLDCFRPMTATLNKSVVLGDATHLSPVLDLSELDGSFVLPSAGYTMSMAEGATVQVRLGERKGISRAPIITWAGDKPEWVDALRFVNGDSGRQYGITVKDDGIYAVSGLIISFH